MWRQVCHQYVTNNPGKAITRYQFSTLFSKAWMESMTMSNFTAAFKVTGIYPVNREVISFPREETSLSKTVVYPTLRPAPKHSTHPQRRRMTSQRRKLSSSTGDIRMTMNSVTPGTICGLLHILTHLFTSECGYNLCRPLQSASFCSVSCLQHKIEFGFKISSFVLIHLPCSSAGVTPVVI